MLTNGPLRENANRKGGEKQARGKRELQVQPYYNLRLLANTDTDMRAGLSGGLILLEFQQVAIDLVVHIGVIFLLTQV